MKRHSAQRDSTANQVHSMLEQAVDELHFVKNQEERALESQVKLIRESYALRLEVFQQQYLNKVAEIEDEMYASIQKRQEECDATILAAAKKLQDQTQQALLKDLAMTHSGATDEQRDSTSISTGMPTSPVSKQRAKLQALEEKLAAFSPESLTRVKSELATPNPSPLSPLRKGPSYWRNGISLEARDEDEDFPARANRSSNNDLPVGADTSRKRQPTSLLSRRFLRPEEEEELRHLRTSIGLAKDWMAKNSHA
ncbi:hypothetical protein PHYSODRAFT_494773 [Phytophthora sojae]|uniref:Uncharacterized protein n=1 Tax=Phytophthora sojae (strain P6497) TaxID=1094619 RepID=G4Z682_PHYSP|nr:hypothetical protein PHYSODRAFT_494773 [Phytophthora sojae]EGZ21697.1 hypothetical protein PHYSODRAFT_494773 [Phytophthora sojae]|eukprot:XP_009524414.1 hypothetical protein PHYSODRAFT_494773 [Phytophthora sojae]